jgi:hypothetical protein
MTDDRLCLEATSEQGMLALLHNESAMTCPGRGPEGDELLLAYFRAIGGQDRRAFWSQLSSVLSTLWQEENPHAFYRGCTLVRRALAEADALAPVGSDFLSFVDDWAPESQNPAEDKLSLAASALELLGLFGLRDSAFWGARVRDAYALLPDAGGYAMRRYLHAAWIGYASGHQPTVQDWQGLLFSMLGGQRFYKLEAISAFNNQYERLSEHGRNELFDILKTALWQARDNAAVERRTRDRQHAETLEATMDRWLQDHGAPQNTLDRPEKDEDPEFLPPRAVLMRRSQGSGSKHRI